MWAQRAALLLLANAFLPRCAAAKPALRILLNQGIKFYPRKGSWLNDCTNVSESGCHGGAAALGAVFRAEAEGAEASVRLLGVEVGPITFFHPDGWMINELLGDRLGVDVAMIDGPHCLTGDNFDSVLSWMQNARRPLVVSNHAVRSPYVGALDSYLSRSTIINAGGVRVGLVVIWPPRAFLPITSSATLPAIAPALRRGGADIVVAVAADNSAHWRPYNLSDFAGLADVVIPPHCGGETGCEDLNEPLLLNGTWLTPSVDRGNEPPYGHYVGVVDFVRDATGALHPSSGRAVPLLEELPGTLRGTAAYRADLEWTQLQVDRAAANDPVVGVSTGAVADGRVDVNGVRMDEVCRRDFCPIGALSVAVMAKRFPDHDVYIWNGGGMRKGWDAGPVTVGDIYGALPFRNSLCAYNTTAPELWRFFEKFAANPNSDGSYDPDSETSPGGFPQTGGVRFEFDPARPRQQRLVSLTWFNSATGQWQELERTRYYRVLTNDFLCEGGDGYDMEQHGDMRVIQVYLQDLIVEEFRRAGDGGLSPPAAPSIVRLNDPAPPLRLVPLGHEDCGPRQRHLPQWKACADCPEGMVTDPIDPADCAHPPGADGDMTWLWVLIGVGGLIIVVVPPVAWRLTENWRRIRRLHSREQIAISCAESIAAMRLEEVAYIREIRNPDRIQTAFIDIIRVLTEYRSFLPQALLLGQDDADADDDAEKHDRKLTSSNPLESGVINVLPRGSAARSSFSSSRRTSMISSSAGAHRYFTGNRGQVEATGFHAVTEAILQAVDAARGVLDHLSGDRAMVSFGAVRNCGDRLAVVRSALGIAEGIKAAGEEPYVGTERGSAHIGTIGTSTTRKHTIMGLIVNIAYACSRVARQHAVPVLAGQRLASETETEVQYWALCVLRGAKLSRAPSRALVLSEVVAVRDAQENDEWMYQMANATRGDPHAEWNKQLLDSAASTDETDEAAAASQAQNAPDQHGLRRALAATGAASAIPVDVAF